MKLCHPLPPILFTCAFLVVGCGDGNSASDAGVDAGPEVDTDTDTNTSTDLDDTGTDSVSDMTMEIHQQVATLLVVSWTQNEEVDSVWIEFTFENGVWLSSPEKPGTTGAHREVIIGVPEYTEVTARVVNELDGTTWTSGDIVGSNDGPPPEMPRPQLTDYDPGLASPHKWILGSVEASKSEAMYWESPWWIFIMDRNARIVWYYHNPLDSRILFPRISPDGTHIIFDEHQGGVWYGYNIGIYRRTLDLEYAEDIPLADMNWCYDITDDGHILYNYFEVYGYEKDYNGVLRELSLEDGSIRDIWNCAQWIKKFMLGSSVCYSNTVNWVKERDSVIVSLAWEPGTVLEIDRQTGEVLGQWGNLTDGWAMNPSDVRLDLQHFPDITKDGTLLLSSREDPYGLRKQNVMEFELDEANETANLIWSYEVTEEFAEQGGEATRVDNGNTLVSFGTGGVIEEVTPDKETAWRVIFDASFTQATNNRLVGHLVLLDDLYALNEGPSD